MGSSGYVYVLLNQSLPGCVKIGKTTRDTATRAVELSSATGVPTPFMVAYEAYFDDCDHAEAYIHALLEVAGVRLADNREFFTLSASEAINAVIQAQAKLVSIAPPQPEDALDYGDQALNELEAIGNNFGRPEPWEQVYYEAIDYLYGGDDVLVLQDTGKAIELFKIAAKLGSEEAHIRLGNLCADAGDYAKGLDWIKSGADKGFSKCWIELAQVFSGENSSFQDALSNRENAVKCYRRFFEIVANAPVRFDAEGNKLYFYLRRYLDLLSSRGNERDIIVLRNFIAKFQSMLLALPNESDAKAKCSELNKLLEQYQLHQLR